MHNHNAYGLSICSVLPLPELRVSAEAGADITIRFGEVHFPVDIENSDHDFHLEPRDAYLLWKTIGKFHIHDGREIVIDPIPEATEAAIRLPLLGTVLAILLHQRGYLVLHGSCVAVNGGAAAILGNKGWGKSTLAATLYGRGHQLITDDIVLVDLSSPGQPEVIPGFPQFKLWPDAAETLGVDPDGLPRLLPQYEKRSRRVTDRFPNRSFPLRKVYVIAGGEAPEIVPMNTQEALMHLICHTYSARFGNELLKGTEGSRHFKQISRLINESSVCFLRRHSSLEALPEIARMVEADIDAARPALDDTDGASASTPERTDATGQPVMKDLESRHEAVRVESKQVALVPAG